MGQEVSRVVCDVWSAVRDVMWCGVMCRSSAMALLTRKVYRAERGPGRGEDYTIDHICKVCRVVSRCLWS